MMNCWQNEPKARPSFTALTKELKEMENQHKVRLLLPSDIKLISVTSAECNDSNCSAINHFEVAQETGSRWFQSALWDCLWGRICTWRQIRLPKQFTMHFDNLVSRPTAKWLIGLIISCNVHYNSGRVLLAKLSARVAYS